MSIDQTDTRASARRAWILFALALVPYLALVAHFNFVTDDAYINFRYAKHLAAGFGFVFNPGVEGPVEGTSELLWVLLLTPIELLGLDPTVWARVFSITAGIALLWRLARFLVRDLGLSTPAAAMGLIWVATMPPFTAWSTGGLSTMPFALVLFLLYERLCGPRTPANGWVTGLLALAMVLLRAESLPWALTLIAIGWWFARRDREPERSAAAWRALGVLLAGFALFIAWRVSYFGYPLPNTAYAKVGGTLEQLQRGAYYLARFVTILPATPLLVAAALWIVWRERTRALVGAAAMVAVSAAFALAVGGDFMCMFRFAAPAVPFLGVLLAASIERMWRMSTLARRAAVTLFALNVACSLAASFGFEPVRGLVRRLAGGARPGADEAGDHQTQFEQLRWQRFDSRIWTDLGLAMKRHCKPTDSLIARGIGAVSYYSDLTIYDRHGLVSAEVSHGNVQRTRGAAGHDLFVGLKFFEHHQPTYAYAGLHPREELDHADPVLFRRIFRVKGDPDMARVYRPVVIPVPEFGRGDWYLLLAERDPAPDGSENGWRQALLEPANLRPGR